MKIQKEIESVGCEDNGWLSIFYEKDGQRCLIDGRGTISFSFNKKVILGESVVDVRLEIIGEGEFIFIDTNEGEKHLIGFATDEGIIRNDWLQTFRSLYK